MTIGTLQLKGGTTSILVNNNTSTAADFENSLTLDSADSYSIGGAGNMTLSGTYKRQGRHQQDRQRHADHLGRQQPLLNGYTGNTIISGGTLSWATLRLGKQTLDYSKNGGSLSFGTMTSAVFGGLEGSGSRLRTWR